MPEIFRYLPDGFEEPNTVLDALKVGRAILAEDGRWCQRESYTIDDPLVNPQTPFCDSWKVCSVGALWVALVGMKKATWWTAGDPRWIEASPGDGPPDEFDAMERRVNLYNRTVAALDKAVQLIVNPNRRERSTVTYNDNSTYDEVVAVWDAAIKAAS